MVPLHIRWSHAVLKGREHSDNKKPQADGDRFSLHQQTDIPASQHSDTMAKKGLCSQRPLHPNPLHLARESSGPSAAVTGTF